MIDGINNEVMEVNQKYNDQSEESSGELEMIAREKECLKGKYWLFS